MQTKKLLAIFSKVFSESRRKVKEVGKATNIFLEISELPSFFFLFSLQPVFPQKN